MRKICIRILNITVVTAATLVLFGCALFTPNYVPATDSEQVAMLNIKQLMRPEICVEGKWFRLKKNREGNAIIPAGKKITLKTIFFVEKDDAYQDLFFTCKNSLSFDSQPSTNYYANFDIRCTDCILEVFAQDNQNAVGISPIPVGPGECE